MTWQTVINGSAGWSVEAADCLDWLAQLPADCVDLAMFSPPYDLARSYGVNFNKAGQSWSAWMVQVFLACRRVCKGMIVCVCDGQTRNFAWSGSPMLLGADLIRMGFCLRHPACFVKVSAIPGGGGAAVDHRDRGGSADGWRNDWEFILITTRGGRLPWADGLACGHPPKWAPGGAMSNRASDGTRVNQSGTTSGDLVKASSNRRSVGRQAHTKAKRNGDEDQIYSVPAIANPGNVIRCSVGGGQMGHNLAHFNEAPYPVALCERFVRSFCPPHGVVLDCFAGSGTTGHAALAWGRRFVGCDLRRSQVDLSVMRLEGVTGTLFAE